MSQNNPMEDVLNGILAAADRDTADTIVYKDIMEADKDSDAYHIFETYEMAASEHAMVVCKIVKQKYGIKRMDDELYWYIVEFPSRIKALEREIEKNEGSTCCVDKAWSRSITRFAELIQVNQAKQGILTQPEPEQPA